MRLGSLSQPSGPLDVIVIVASPVRARYPLAAGNTLKTYLFHSFLPLLNAAVAFVFPRT